MKVLLVAAVALGGLAGQAVAGGKGDAGRHYEKAPRATAQPIIVSCFRGPWKDVIWDRPNAKFVDSLVSLGYDFPTAHAIGERVCRDEALVNNPDGLRAEILRIVKSAPRRR